MLRLTKRLSKTVFLCLVFILTISIFVNFVPVYGDSYSLTVSTDASNYAPGARVTISGSLTDITTNSATASALVSIKVTDPSGGSVYTTIATTSSTGTYAITYITDKGTNQPTGTYTIAATASSSGNSIASASSTYTVITSPRPTITISPTNGPAGTSVTVSGIGYSGSSTINIALDGISQTTSPSTVTSSSSGSFSCRFTVPSSLVGAHVVQATDASTSLAATFVLTAPSITITPVSGYVGSTVTISGNGFAPSSIVTVKFDSTSQATNPATLISSSSGSISCTLTVPTSLSGVHTVQFTDRFSNSALATFTVTVPTPTPSANPTAAPTPTPSPTPSPKPTITVNPTSGLVGTTVKVTGSGFANSATITIAFDGISLTTTPTKVTSSASGDFICYFTVPTCLPGAHTVQAIDSSHSAITTFILTVPTVTITPTSGNIGSTITISCSGFLAFTTLKIMFDDSYQTTNPSTVTSSSNGGATCTIIAPASISGVHTVKVTDGSSNSASSVYTITAPTPTYTLTVTSDAQSYGRGAQVNISGLLTSTSSASGYLVTIRITDPLGNNAYTTIATTTATGAYSASFVDQLGVSQPIGIYTVLVNAALNGNSVASNNMTYIVTTSLTPTPTPTPTQSPTPSSTPSPTPSPSPAPAGWNATLTSSQDSYSDTCTFGVKSDATYGFNTAYDQVKSPSPPQGVYSYFNYPSNPNSPVNLQKLGTSIVGPWPADNANWTYQVKAVGTDGPMTISWSNIAIIPSTYVVTLLNGTDSATVANMRQTNSYTFQATADITYTFTIQVTTNAQFTINLSAGWNMVSFPMIPSNPSFSSIFSNVGYYQVLTWNGNGYVTPTTAEAGTGYWILVLNNTNITITGQPVTNYQLSVQPGWSVIGGINGKTVNAYYLFGGSFYELLTWNGSQYVTATTIEPGKSYWLLVTSTTNVTVS